MGDLVQLIIDLQNDAINFEAKQKLSDFLASCNTIKAVEDCYRETFEYFKPIFGYIITKIYIDGSSHEHKDFLDVLNKFLIKAERTDNFQRHPIRLKLSTLREKFRYPQIYFNTAELSREYRPLNIYRESYEHNVKNLQEFLKRNSTFETGLKRTMLDWTMYVYQSRNKPMSYYYSTLNVHLWMTLYNNTERFRDSKHFSEIAECLALPQYVNVLEEARILAVVYLKSFRNSWQDYRDWITSSTINQDIFNQENDILKKYNLHNKNLFFTFYAQNFCDFGKELAENIFYLGLKQNHDFYAIYSCGFQSERTSQCI